MYQIKLPVLTNAKAVNDIECQQKNFSLSIVCYFIITIIGTVFCALFMGQIISLIGSNTAFNAFLFLGVALYYIPENNYAIHAGYISTGNELPFVKSLVLTSIARVFLLFILIKVADFGILGIVFAGIISNYAYIVWKWPNVALKQLSLNPLNLVILGTRELRNIILSLICRNRRIVIW